MEKFSWKNEAALVARLTKIQNSPKYQNQDIMTFALGFASSKEDLTRTVRGFEGKHTPANLSAVKLDQVEIDTARGMQIAWGR